MDACVEVWARGGARLIALAGDRLAIGRDVGNDLVLDDDTAVSRQHALIERLPAGWSLRDLGSRNGTIVNGERLAGERALRNGDEIRIGAVRLHFRDATAAGDLTVGLDRAPLPHLTRREVEVLVALCRPLLVSTGHFAEPASVRVIAAELHVTEAAIKQHLVNLYDKFGLLSEDRRRTTLANTALERHAVTADALRGAP